MNTEYTDTDLAADLALVASASFTDAPEAPVAAPAAPAPRPVPMQRINRRVYVDHKKFGTCITISATVYLCPAGTTFAAKTAPKCDFIVMDGRVFDANGAEWVSAGENPGCGPRCPSGLRDTYGKTWASFTHAERKEILKALVTPVAK